MEDCKTQLKNKGIDSFLRLIKRIGDIITGERILLAVTYQTSPIVKRYAESKGIKIYYSYEMPL